MSPRTVCPPPTDKGMWRRLIARVHPDAGGSNDLFIWTRALQEHVADDAIEKPEYTPPRHTTNGDSDRVPFEIEDFENLTYRALVTARSVPEKYACLLRLLDNCDEAHHGPLVREQRRGASYRRLAAIGHTAGVGLKERSGWYRIAESIPFSDRHAGHILGKLKRRAS